MEAKVRRSQVQRQKKRAASKRTTLVFLFLLAVSWGVESEELEIIGDWYPGALLQGRVTPGTAVSLSDRSIYVDTEGRFVFGLGRDEKGSFPIVIKKLQQEEETYRFQIASRKYDIQKVNGVAAKYVSPPESVLSRIRQESALVAKARKTNRLSEEFRSGFILPAKGPITGVYGSQRVFNGVPKRPHFGLDVAGAVGQEVIAPASGVVILAHNNMYYSGGTLLVDHGQGVSSTFIHLSKILVKEGEVVKQGQKIAEIGATGRVTGPHLDWRVNWFQIRLDPALLVKKLSAN